MIQNSTLSIRLSSRNILELHYRKVRFIDLCTWRNHLRKKRILINLSLISHQKMNRIEICYWSVIKIQFSTTTGSNHTSNNCNGCWKLHGPPTKFPKQIPMFFYLFKFLVRRVENTWSTPFDIDVINFLIFVKLYEIIQARLFL